MFAKSKRIRPDGGELEIVYEVQWKTPGNDDDKAKIIGILDTPDTTLDWNTFKSYLIQNSGNMRLSTDDIKISYVDSDDDVIPVDSEIEFRECLKFSRIRARHGRKITMKVGMTSNGGAKPKEMNKSDDTSSKSTKPKLFCLKKKDITEKKKYTVTFDKAGSPDMENTATMPEWFDNYMIKFKAELIQEITDAVISNVKSSVGASPHTHTHSRRSVLTEPSSSKYHVGHIIEKRKKKKKISEEDSSDCTDGLQLQWEEKIELLRHMQKISKREKKFEKKLDAKLEKLESKTKKIMEKKSHGLFNEVKPGEVKLKGAEMKRRARMMVLGNASNIGLTPPNEQVMDALPVDEYNYVPHVLKGEIVTQAWKVVNNGHLPWTDETELRFAWGSKSLVPLTTSAKCPLLQPGESGKVKVKLQAPMFEGNFESYWHFHHGGRRFGHWLGCAVIVDSDQHCETPIRDQASAPPEPQCSDTAVDLTMKCPKYVTSTTDDMKMFNSEVKEREGECCIKEIDNVIQHPDKSTLIAQPETNSWPNYSPNQQSVPVGDLLNIKEGTDHENKPLVDKEVKIENVTEGITNLTIYGVPEEWKNSEIPAEVVKEEDERQNAEYISASDSDNISVISGTISVDSDESEPSEEFVVIPMPQCFNCEQALTENLSVTQPISVEIPKSPSGSDISAHLHASDNNNNMELKPYPEMPMFLPVLMTPNESAQGQESGYSEGENEPEKPADLPEDPVIDDKDPNNVYIRDSTGKSVPVAKVLRDRKDDSAGPKMSPPGFSVNVGISHSTFGDPNVGHGPNGPRFPFGFVHESGTVPPQCHNPGGSANFRPQHDCPKTPSAPPRPPNAEQFCPHPCPETNPFKKSPESCHCPNMPHFPQSFPQNFAPNFQHKCSFGQRPCHKNREGREVRQGQGERSTSSSSASSSASWSHSFQNIHTEQPRSCKYAFTFEKEPKKQPSPSSNASSRRSPSSTESREHSPVAAAVQILPETLVTGAVNVASSAINTARTVIDMLIPRHDDVVTGHWEQIPKIVEDSLRTLAEMGFNNRELNIMLLKRHNNDVTRVISELIQ